MDLLKMDKNMFLSFVNMKLRDEFSDIEDLCSFYDVKVEDVNEKLQSLGLSYVRDVNQIKSL